MTSTGSTARKPERRQSSFRGDVFRLATGTGLAQLIGVVSAPIVTRLFAPEAYGVAALFASLTAILGIVACLRYELSIVLPEDDSDAANLLWLSLRTAVIAAGATGLGVWFVGSNVVAWLDAPEIGPLLWLLPLAVLVHGAFSALKYWNTRTRHFTRQSVAEITGRASGTVGVISAGATGFTTGSVMIVGAIAGNLLAALVLAGQVIRDNGRFLLESYDRRKIAAGARQHRRFPIFGTWAALLNTVSWQLPVLLFGVFFSPAVAGFYALGFRILQMPMSLIGGAIGRVFHQRAAEANLRGELAPLVQNLLKMLAIAGLAPMIALAIAGEDLFAVVFGGNWSEAGVYAQILSPWAFVWFISSPLSTLFGVLSKQAQGLVVQIAIFASRLVSIGVGTWYGDVRLALALFSITGIVVYGGLIIHIVRLSGVRALSLLDYGILKALLLGIGLALTLVLIDSQAGGGIPLIVAAGVLVGTYFALVWRDLLACGQFDETS